MKLLNSIRKRRLKNAGSGKSRRAVLCAAAGMLTLSFVSACSIFPEKKQTMPEIFDIGIPDAKTLDEAKHLSCDVDILPFTSESAARYKMLYRTGSNQIRVDEYNRWTLPPGPLLTKYLKLAFRDTGQRKTEKDAIYQISGSVLNFEADLSKNCCRLYVLYVISHPGADAPLFSSSALIEEPMKDNSSEAFSMAMEKAASLLSAQINADLQKVLKQEAPPSGKTR